jgi:Tfp pilus assembly protein PilF
MIAVLAVYWGVLGHQFLEFDDNTYVYENPLIYPLVPGTVVRLFTTTYFRSYTPLTLLSHAIDYDLWGMNPFGHHLTSLLLHMTNTSWMWLLACVVLLSRGDDPARGGDTDLSLRSRLTPGVLAGATLASALFAFHPLRVESVAWISDRKDLLMGFFSFPALISYLLYSSARGTPKATAWFRAVIVCSGLAMLSKTVAITLPLIFLLIDALFPRQRERSTPWRALLKEKFSLLLMSAAGGILSLIAIRGVLRHPPLDHPSVVERLLQPFYALAFYLGKIFWPANLSPIYGPASEAAHVLALFVVLGITALCLLRAKKGDPAWLLVWSVYVVLLFPTVFGSPAAGIQPWADRYTYLPSVPIALGVGALVRSMWVPNRIAAVAAPVFLLAPLTFLTVRQIPAWVDSEHLWRHAVAVDPGVTMAQVNLAMILGGNGKADEAVAASRRAIALGPRYAKAYGALGLALDLQGDTSNAIQAFVAAASLDSNFIDAYSNLGNITMRQGRYAEAIRQYERAIERDPSFFPAYYNMGIAYYNSGDAKRAMEIFEKTVRVNPIFPDTYVNMAIIRTDWGDTAGARELYRKAAELGSGSARQIPGKH